MLEPALAIAVHYLQPFFELQGSPFIEYHSFIAPHRRWSTGGNASCPRQPALTWGTPALLSWQDEPSSPPGERFLFCHPLFQGGDGARVRWLRGRGESGQAADEITTFYPWSLSIAGDRKRKHLDRFHAPILEPKEAGIDRQTNSGEDVDHDDAAAPPFRRELGPGHLKGRWARRLPTRATWLTQAAR